MAFKIVCYENLLSLSAGWTSGYTATMQKDDGFNLFTRLQIAD